MLCWGLWNVWLMSGQVSWLIMVSSSRCRRRLGGGDSTSIQRRKVCRVMANFNWTVAVSRVVWAFRPDGERLWWIWDACEVCPH